MTIAVLAIQAVVFSILSGAIAANKNRSVELWCFLGFLLGLLGFITVLALGEKQSANSQRQRSQNLASRGFNPDQHEKKCPMCAEYIKLEARRCKHCGHEFSKEEVERQVEEIRESVKGSESASEGEKDERNYKPDEYDTEEILSTHDFNGVGMCEDCDYTREYVKANNYVCPES